MHEEVALLYKWFKEDYLPHADLLFQVCIDNPKESLPFFAHVNLAIDYCDRDRKKFSTELTQALLSGYSFLASAILCLDALVDGHSLGMNDNIQNSELAKALTLLLTGGLTRLRVFYSQANIERYNIESKIISIFSEHISAQNQELENYRLTDGIVRDSDYKNSIERSNFSLFMFEIVALACEKEIPQRLYKSLNDFIYTLQLADDISDWKTDFESGRYSSFIRECLSMFKDYPSLAELEQFIYLRGFYESRLAQVVVKFDAVIDDLNSIGATDTLLLKYVGKQRELAKQGLAKFINEKKRFLEDDE